MGRLATLMLVLAGTLPGAAWSEDAAPSPNLAADRQVAYDAFTTAFKMGRYNNALAAANRVLALTRQIEPESLAVSSALNNVATVQLRLGDYLAAETAYIDCLKFLEQRQGSTSKRLINPLRGLGMTYRAQGREAEAVAMLQRAAGISRRTDGLFNPTQLELIEPLVAGYVALGRYDEAEREEQYAYRTLTVQAGNDERKLVPALNRLASWYADTGRTTQARGLYSRAYTLANFREPRQPAAAVEALRGMADTYVLEYQNGPEILETANPEDRTTSSINPPTSQISGMSSNLSSYVLNPDGEKTLIAAIGIAQKDGLSPDRYAALVVDLADWYLISDRADKAVNLLDDAERMFAVASQSAGAESSPLHQPALLYFRAPPSTRRFQNRARADVDEKVVVLEFTVTAAGRVADLKVIEGDIPDSQRDSLLSAFAKAQFRPRIVDGKPVDTPGQHYRQVYRSLKKDTPAG